MQLEIEIYSTCPASAGLEPLYDPAADPLRSARDDRDLVREGGGRAGHGPMLRDDVAPSSARRTGSCKRDDSVRYSASSVYGSRDHMSVIGIAAAFSLVRVVPGWPAASSTGA